MILEGRMKKFYEQICLVDQPWIKDEKGKKTIGELLDRGVRPS